MLLPCLLMSHNNHPTTMQSFKFIVDGYGQTVTQARGVQIMEMFEESTQLRGRIDLRAPANRFWVLFVEPGDAWGMPELPERYYFGREVAAPVRRGPALQRYALPRRRYLGPTSMDAELSFIMCNLGKVGAAGDC